MSAGGGQRQRAVTEEVWSRSGAARGLAVVEVVGPRRILKVATGKGTVECSLADLPRGRAVVDEGEGCSGVKVCVFGRFEQRSLGNRWNRDSCRA